MMGAPGTVYIIADIEGTSGCWNYEGSRFRTAEWADACVEMSRDMNAVVTALLDSGVKSIYVKDFHRTGYNLLPELIDTRVRVIHGYRRGPVPGIGNSFGSERLLMIGMHAPSGSDGFLAHTLTSRIARLEVNGRLMGEAEFFASSLADFGLRPVFLSGCPVACRYAREAIPGIRTCAIEKTGSGASFDHHAWRRLLSRRAVEALDGALPEPFRPRGPFKALVTMRDGEDEAEKMARRWGIERSGAVLHVMTDTIGELYLALIRICYLTPFVERILPAGLLLFNAMGRAGLTWVRRTVKRNGPFK